MTTRDPVPLMCVRCVERHLAALQYDLVLRSVAATSGRVLPWSEYEPRVRRNAVADAREYAAVHIRSWWEPHAGA